LNKDFYDLRLSDGKRKRMKFKLWVRVSSVVNGNPIRISTEIEETEGFGFAVIEGQTVALSAYLINK
jgi:hypothetical protein